MRPVVFTFRVGSLATRTVRAWARRIADHVVQNVPEEMSVCEYECQDPRCDTAKLAVCVKCSSHRESAYLRID